MPWVYRPNHPNANENGMVERSELGWESKSSAPYVISDSMEPTKHMATGRTFDSKRAFSRETKAAGCVELGNEQIKPRAPERLNGGKRRDDIRKAIYDLKNGR